MSNEVLHGQQLFVFASRVNLAALKAQAKKLARLERIKERHARRQARQWA